MNVAVCGLSWGDEGKGGTVDHLTREYGASLVIRTGGPQAAHNVVLESGVHHTFSQFGSGMFANADTFLSHHMFVSLGALVDEAWHLTELGFSNPLSRLTIDRDCVVITPVQVAVGQYREQARGTARHGSCGRGVGEAMSDWLTHPDDTITIGNLTSPRLVLDKLTAQWERKMVPEIEPTDVALCAEWAGMLVRVYQFMITGGARVVDRSWLGTQKRRTMIFEASQGALLDEAYGFPPHHTWLKTTFTHAATLALEAGLSPPQHIGVLRSYATRHGPGPFPTEDSGGYRAPGEHNVTNEWQGPFRTGWFDGPLARYAVAACGAIDAISLTHLDAVTAPWRVCDRYSEPCDLTAQPGDLAHQEALGRRLRAVTPTYYHLPPTPAALIAWLEDYLGVPVAYTSTGPTAAHKTPHRVKVL